MPENKIKKKMDAQTLQSMFMHIQLDVYFDVLADMLGDPSIKKVYTDKLLHYTALADDYTFDFVGDREYPPFCLNKFTTVGELLCAAGKMMNLIDYDFTYLGEDEYEYNFQAEGTGMMIITELLIKPLLKISGLYNASDEEEDGDFDPFYPYTDMPF